MIAFGATKIPHNTKIHGALKTFGKHTKSSGAVAGGFYNAFRVV